VNHSDLWQAGEAFVVLDAGGGTVDLTSYTMTNSYPAGPPIQVGKPNGKTSCLYDIISC